LCFMLKISTPSQCFFLVRVKMISKFCPILLPCQFLRLTDLLMYLLMLISGIVNWVILLLVFSFFLVSNNKLTCNSRRSTSQC
jgi:hypothetical protein